jgi:hypothetical protein
MVVQDRYSALQNENVRLYRTFETSGNLSELPDLPVVTIIDQNGVDPITTITATMQNAGIYFVDYFVPIDADLGQYYDKWTYSFSGDTAASEAITHFEIHPKDSTLNFTSSLISQKYTNLMERAIRDLANYFIYEVQHIPVYGEQAMRTASLQRFNFAFGNWNQDPRPTIRNSSKLISKGWYPDYNGNVFFDDPFTSNETIYAHYNFAYFSKEEIAGFLDQGIGALNAIPPVSSYRTIEQIPYEWSYGILLYAAVLALRRVLLGMSMQERSIIFGTGDQLSSARDIVRELYQSYLELWKEVSEGIKKKLPNIGMIVIPEYTLPGGRARWYRYLYVSSTG